MNKTPEELAAKWKAETDEILADTAVTWANARATDVMTEERRVIVEIAVEKQKDLHAWEENSLIVAKIFTLIMYIVLIYLALFTVKCSFEWFKPESPQIRQLEGGCAATGNGEVICRGAIR